MGNLFVKQNKELTEEEKQKEEARKEELRNKRKEKQAQYDNYAKEQQEREANDIVAKEAAGINIEEEKPAKNFVDNSNEAVANAKVGDWIKRKDGTEVQLTQSDIDAAKPKPAVEAPVENIKEQVEVESESTPEAAPEATSEGDLPQNIIDELDASDEGQYAKKAVEDGDLFQLANITDPEGNPVLKGTFDENGYYVPHTYTIAETRLVKNKGMAAALTIISRALTAAGAIAGVPIPPINFLEFGSNENDLERLNQVEKDYEKLVNEPKKAGETQKAEALGSATGRQEAYENQATSANENPNLYNTAVQNQVAGAQAAVGGQNTQLDVAKQEQEWQSKEKELDRDFAKVMNDMNTESQIAILKQQAINQQDLAKLMYDQDVQRVFKKIEYGRAHGMSEDDVAKWIRAEQGTTKLMAGMKMGTDAANAAANIVGTFMPGESDKNVKKYDWGKSNSDMLKKAFKWR